MILIKKIVKIICDNICFCNFNFLKIFWNSFWSSREQNYNKTKFFVGKFCRKISETVDDNFVERKYVKIGFWFLHTLQNIAYLLGTRTQFSQFCGRKGRRRPIWALPFGCHQLGANNWVPRIGCQTTGFRSVSWRRTYWQFLLGYWTSNLVGSSDGWYKHGILNMATNKNCKGSNRGNGLATPNGPLLESRVN